MEYRHEIGAKTGSFTGVETTVNYKRGEQIGKLIMRI